MANYDLGDIEVGFVMDGLERTSKGIQQFVREIKSAEASANAFTKAQISNTRRINGATFSREELNSLKSIRQQLLVTENTRKQIAKTESQDTAAWFAQQRQKVAMMKVSSDMEAKAARDAAAAQSAADTKAMRSLQALMAFRSRMNRQRVAEEQEAIREQQAFNSQVQAAINASNSEYDALESKYNSAAVAAKHYTQVQQELVRAEKLGIITKEQLQTELAKLEAEYSTFNRGMATAQNRFSRVTNAVEQSRKGFAKYGMAVQQTGYQVGDFFVQVQSGQNALVAFGQQATQLAGLGFLSANPVIQIGAAIASVGIPLLTAFGAYWMRAGDSAKEAGDKMSDAIKGLQSDIDSLNLENIKFGFGIDKDSVARIKQEIFLIKNEIQNIINSRPTATSLNARTAYVVSAANENLDEKLTLLTEEQMKAEELLSVYEGQLEAQRMLLGIGSTAKNLSDQKLRTTLDEWTAAAELKKENLETLTALQRMATIQINGVFFRGEAAARGLLGVVNSIYTKMQAVAWLKQNSSGGSSYLAYQYAAYGEGRQAFNDEVSKHTVDTTVGGGGPETDPVAELQEQIKLETELLNKTEAYKEVINALGNEWQQYSPDVIEGLIAQVEELDRLKAALEEQQHLWDTVKDASTDAFMDIITGTESAVDAFRSMAYEIIKELYNVLVVQRMVGSFDAATGSGTGLIGLLSGALTGLATGGPMNAGTPYLVGEKGPELVVPRNSGTVINNKQTQGILSSGNGSQTVNNNISVVGSDSEMVRREIVKMIPQIASVTISAMVDAKKRGGQVGAAFR